MRRREREARGEEREEVEEGILWASHARRDVRGAMEEEEEEEEKEERAASKDCVMEETS